MALEAAISLALFHAPFGPLVLRCVGERLLAIELAPGEDVVAAARSSPPRWLGAVLDDYFETAELPKESVIAVRLAPRGSAFQRRLWARLRAIPRGQTLSYGALARELGSSPRAVGQACRANPWPILTPCHRVVAARGLGGFVGARAGRGLAIKRWLLHHEGFDWEGRWTTAS